MIQRFSLLQEPFRRRSSLQTPMSFYSCTCFTGLHPHVSVVSDCVGPPSSEVQRVSHTVTNQMGCDATLALMCLSPHFLQADQGQRNRPSITRESPVCKPDDMLRCSSPDSAGCPLPYPPYTVAGPADRMRFALLVQTASSFLVRSASRCEGRSGQTRVGISQPQGVPSR